MESAIQVGTRLANLDFDTTGRAFMTPAIERAIGGEWSPLSRREVLSLARERDLERLLEAAASLRDRSFGTRITYSRKVFAPLTSVCRGVCHHCTVATTPGKLASNYPQPDEVLTLVQQGAELGCKEVLFTLGERPELRCPAARDALADLGFPSTFAYLAHVADRVVKETGILPHINAGGMSLAEMRNLRKVSASMGLVLESASERLCAPAMPHYGSPDKLPARRLDTLRLAGALMIPFTTGLLIGIGETRRERVEALLALRDASSENGQLQEVIIQSHHAMADTRMAHAPEPALEELQWTIAVARLVLGPDVSLQAPPNLSPSVVDRLIDAGINDWGGVSPLSADHVNPKAPWSHLDELARQTTVAGKQLVERLTVYPRYIRDGEIWLDPQLRARVMNLADGGGLARSDRWRSGTSKSLPSLGPGFIGVDADVERVLAAVRRGADLDQSQIEALFHARGESYRNVLRAAKALSQERHGDHVSYVVNRNINYTNMCTFHCSFCAFSKSTGRHDRRDSSDDLSDGEITRRVHEAWQQGATEVCLQGGIHPGYTGQKYLDLCKLVKSASPQMHVHAFSPLEVLHGATSLGAGLAEYLQELRHAGLASLPGTAAEILDDRVRLLICPDKLTSAQWLEVMATAHDVGLRSTATIMFGHVDAYEHWAHHLLQIRQLQRRTGGFTEFVPLPFVAAEAPIYRRGLARPGPDFREALLMHAVSRLVLHKHIENIQASWVKLGLEGALACTDAGANDLGGTLMNESITRAAGADHGQALTPGLLRQQLNKAGKTPWERTTFYARAPSERQATASTAVALIPLRSMSAESWV